MTSDRSKRFGYADTWVGLTLMVGSSLLTWLEDAGGTVSDAVRLGVSPACNGGLGVFVQRPLSSFEPLATVPLSACISAVDACEDADIGPVVRDYLVDQRGELGADAVAVAALLAHARHGKSPSARARWRGYLESLPLDVSTPSSVTSFGSPDPLAPILAREYILQRKELDALATSVYEVLGGRVGKVACCQALRVTASRCFSLTPFFGPERRRSIMPSTADGVLVPFLDVFNHPSRSALAVTSAGEQFARTALQSAVCRWAFDDTQGVVHVYAPELAGPVGSEIFNMYDLAGANNEFAPNNDFLGLQTSRLLAATWSEGMQQTWAEGEAFFIARYGFSPWE
jgi:hypothetical protein